MGTGSIQLLCVEAGGSAVAVDIMVVREILRAPKVTPVPGTPPHVAGVANLRGDLIPVVDLCQAVLGQPRASGANGGKLVVVRGSSRPAGLLVDEVLEVISLPAGELRPVPTGSACAAAVVAAFQARLSDGDPRVALLVRPAALELPGDPSAGTC